MSGQNLNPNPVLTDTKARFDIKKHVHEEKPFFSGVKMFATVVVSVASLAAGLLGGTYLLLFGPPPDFYQKPVEMSSENGNKLSPAQEKSLQEKVASVMDEYRSGWNGGTFPANLTVTGFTAKDMVGKESTSPSDYYDSKQTIEKIKVVNIAQVTADEVSATVDELVQYDTGMKNWFINAGGTSQDGDLVIKRIVESEYRLVNSGGWKIKSREWKRQTGALIQQRGDATLSWQIDEGAIQFDDKRPSKESLSPAYQAIASEIQSGSLSLGAFPSSYRVTFESGGSIGRDEIQGRLSKLTQNVADLKVECEIESVEQTGATSAVATVRYSAEFCPVDSDKQTGEITKSKNKYVAVWRDKDNWTRLRDTDVEWHRLGTTRLKRSPIWQHYEERIPTVPARTTQTNPADSYSQPTDPPASEPPQEQP